MSYGFRKEMFLFYHQKTARIPKPNPHYYSVTAQQFQRIGKQKLYTQNFTRFDKFYPLRNFRIKNKKLKRKQKHSHTLNTYKRLLHTQHIYWTLPKIIYKKKNNLNSFSLFCLFFITVPGKLLCYNIKLHFIMNSVRIVYYNLHATLVKPLHV